MIALSAQTETELSKEPILESTHDGSLLIERNSVMPLRYQEVLQELVPYKSQLTAISAEIGEAFSKQHDYLKDVARALNTSTALTFQTPKLPELRIDYSTLFPDVTAVGKKFRDAVRPSFDLIHALQREQFLDIVALVRNVTIGTLPPNWQDDKISIPDNLEELVIDEGLPLLWVPPSEILAQILVANTPQERRKIIGQSWKHIANACNQEFDHVKEKRLQGHLNFAREAAVSLLGGFSSSSQALSANLLDTILRKELHDDDHKAMTNQGSRPDISDYRLRVGMVVGSIWGVHGRYFPSKGDQVPRVFSRHGTVHGVSKRQYSRVNAVIALMHVTSLLRLLDSDLA